MESINHYLIYSEHNVAISLLRDTNYIMWITVTHESKEKNLRYINHFNFYLSVLSGDMKQFNFGK